MAALEAVEICAGAGGQSLGLHLAGFRHALAVELDPTAAATLRTNLSRLAPETEPEQLVAVGDVADPRIWNPSDYRGRVSLLAGGVPCPPFSVAGKQLGSSDERDLFAWSVELAGRIQPDALLLENVRGLNSPRFAGYRQAVVDRLHELGYVADWELLEARDYGVPQLRPRTVLVALKPDFAPYFTWPEKAPTTETVGSALRASMGANGFDFLEEWVARAAGIAPTIVGGSKKHGGADLGPTRAKAAWEALWVDGHGLADEPPAKGAWDRQLHPRGPRLTTEMVAILQGWSGGEYEWSFAGRKTSRYRQIGNAFPPPVARAVGTSIMRALRKEGHAISAPKDRVMHDEVYRALRDAKSWMTAGDLHAHLRGAIPLNEIEARIKSLSHDFDLYTRRTRRGEAFHLGEWRAFRGQPDHMRSVAFEDATLRRRVS